MEWLPVVGFVGFYEVSSLGVVRSVSRMVRSNPRGTAYKRRIKSRVLSKVDNGAGYHYVTLSSNGKRKNKYVHRMVAEAFVGNPKSLPEVNHINGDKKDNNAINLEWVTSRENSEHASLTGLLKKGLSHCRSKGVIEARKADEVIYLFGKKHINSSGFSSSCVYDCVSGKESKHKGYSFKRISKEEYLEIINDQI